MPPGAGPDEALALAGIVKQYGAVRALDGADLAVARGTLHAVLGENGAGKTTLMRVAYGLVRPDAGELRVNGTARRFESPRDAIAAGIGMVHQHFTIIPAMTVAENVALGGRGGYDPRQAAAQICALSDATGLRLDPNALAGTLSVAAQQRLEVLKALARGGTANNASTRLLILDEPAAMLAPAESEELLRWLRGWVDAGGTAVLVTHKLRDALRHADAVTVLRRGTSVLAAPLRAGGRAAETATDDATLTTAMLGADYTADSAKNSAAGQDAAPAAPSDRQVLTEPVVARLTDVRVVDAAGVTRLSGATLALHAGRVVGVAAVEGSGERELLRVLAGRLAPTAGGVERPPRVAFIPEDRHRDALLLDGSLVENLALAGAGARRGRLRWARFRKTVGTLIAGADVRGGAPGTPARALSGGNQQKFVVARELAGAPALVIADNPTRGLDVRAAAGVRARLRDAAAAGAAVVVHASDLDEVLALADEMLVVYDGTVRRAPVDRSVVGRLMLGSIVGASS